MHGNSTGLEPADASGEGDTLRRAREALSLFNQAAKAACDLGEHKLQREAEDAAARCVSLIEAEQAREARERLGSGQTIHGLDQAQA